jgi:hypothetical protein
MQLVNSNIEAHKFFSYTELITTIKLIMQHKDKIKHLSFEKDCATHCLGQTFHPTIDLLFQIST